MDLKEDLINEIIEKNGYKSYLEIGTDTSYNFDKINCKRKIAVDPSPKKIIDGMYKMTSDDFFEQNYENFNVVFVDGFHHADQVRKDIINAMKCLTKEGAIILHDTIPQSREMQKVPREQRQWTGNVWRTAVGFHKEYPDVEFKTYRSDYGLTVIKPDGKKVRKHFEDKEMTYEEFKSNEVELLNIVD